MPLRIVGLKGPLAGQVFELSDSKLSFGRHSSSGIRIACALASRHHAELRPQAEGYLLCDMRSQNGTYVNDVKVTEHLLLPGDTITIGTESFRLEDEGDDRTLAPEAKLVVLDGELAGTIYPLEDGVLSFGRSAGNSIRIVNKLTSRHHAELRREEEGYRLYDLKSHNGTYVSGVRISEHLLRHNDVLTIGNQRFRYEGGNTRDDRTMLGQGVDERKEVTGSRRGMWVPLPITIEFAITGGDVHLRWQTPLRGEHQTAFTPPFGPSELPVVMKALDALQYTSSPVVRGRFGAAEQSVLEQLGLWSEGRIVPEAYRRVGGALYDALGSAGRDLLDTVRDYGIAQGRPTRYMLRFPEEAASYAMLPWELLHDGYAPLLRRNGRATMSLERYVTARRAPPVVPMHGENLRLLALSPEYGIPPEVREAERMARRRSWEHLRASAGAVVDELAPLTRRGLVRYLREAGRPPDIVHYFGHGEFNDGEGRLYFDSEDGDADPITASQLAAMLADTRLIALHACQSASIGAGIGMLGGIAPALSLVAGAVVGMQLTMSTVAATHFSEVFYDMLLGAKRSLQEAVVEARHELFVREPDSASWFVPALYIRSHDQRPLYIVR